MKKKGNSFVCDVCGYESGKWFGRCPQCGEWNSVKEIIISDKSNPSRSKHQGFLSLKTANYQSKSRIDSGFEHLNRVLGGGLVTGSVNLSVVIRVSVKVLWLHSYVLILKKVTISAVKNLLNKSF